MAGRRTIRDIPQPGIEHLASPVHTCIDIACQYLTIHVWTGKGYFKKEYGTFFGVGIGPPLKDYISNNNIMKSFLSITGITVQCFGICFTFELFFLLSYCFLALFFSYLYFSYLYFLLSVFSPTITYVTVHSNKFDLSLKKN